MRHHHPVRSLLRRIRRRRGQQGIEVPPEVARRASEHLLEMDDRLEQIEALDGLDEFARTRRLPEQFFSLWREAVEAYDQYVATMIDGAELAVRCRSGCDACCHTIPTGVQAIELLALYRAASDLPDFRELHNAACDRTDVLYDLLRLQSPDAEQVMSDSDEYQRAQLAYRQRRLPCVFLDTDTQTCRVYDDRPIPCRMHFSLTDPDWCWVDHDRAGDSINPNLAPPDPIVDIMKRIAKRLGLERLGPSMFPGLARLGAEVMQGEAIGTLKKARRRHPRG